MTGKEYVRQIKKIDTIIRNKIIELKQAEKIGVDATFIKNGINTLLQEKELILKEIQRLNEAEYDVLHKRYVQGATLFEIADERGISYSNVTTIHGRALKNLERLINE